MKGSKLPVLCPKPTYKDKGGPLQLRVNPAKAFPVPMAQRTNDRKGQRLAPLRWCVSDQGGLGRGSEKLPKESRNLV